jgi:hypothetical protein
MRLLFCALIACFVFTTQAQTIEQKKGGRFFIDGRPSSPKEVQSLMSGNPEAFELAKSATANYGVGNVLGFIGGFMIGWPIGTALGGGEPEWVMAGAGAGILAVAIPLVSNGNKKMGKAIELYNGSAPPPKTSLDFQFKGNSVGLAWKF